MKYRIAYFIIVCTLLHITQIFAQRTIIASGAGSTDVNGTYEENGTNDEKPKFEKGGYTIFWVNDRIWAITGPSAIYYQIDDTDAELPPKTGWSPIESGIDPPPELEGDGTLSVELSSFNAKITSQGIILEWITESESDNVGFIIERSVETDRDLSLQWQIIASYQTHDRLKGQGNCSCATEYTFTDMDILAGATYSYRLSDVNLAGKVTILDIVSITLEEIPELTDLLPATPNPFNPSTKIQYTLSENSHVTLKVVNMQGQTIQTIISGQNQTAGSYSIHWNGQNELGIIAPSGTYLLVLNAGQIIKSQKVMLVR